MVSFQTGTAVVRTKYKRGFRNIYGQGSSGEGQKREVIDMDK